ncbi:unnamed protein product [Macrosiphum euphorbiae]|uniref:Uncharacterized protein n=1 Tax=Macrosiphum euphorbiae TaxID=13131 RepID=A0AAV0XKK8_9HEMI|nr:unnamed protein product [Macrosiphum euphorbiae]
MSVANVTNSDNDERGNIRVEYVPLSSSWRTVRQRPPAAFGLDGRRRPFRFKMAINQFVLMFSSFSRLNKRRSTFGYSRRPSTVMPDRRC